MSDQNRITCQECQAKVTRPQLLRKHMESIHHQCSVCKKLHSTKEDLNTHKNDHVKTYDTVNVITHTDCQEVYTLGNDNYQSQKSMMDSNDENHVKNKAKFKFLLKIPKGNLFIQRFVKKKTPF